MALLIFSQLPRVLPGRMLVIAHREELLDQAAEKIEWANPELTVDVEQANRHSSPEAQVVVASIQTLATSPHRLDALGPDSFRVIVVDEAHHIVAHSYLRVLAALGLAPDVSGLTNGELTRRSVSLKVRRIFQDFRPSPDAPLLVGYTATPSRTDGRGLEFVLDEIVYSKSILEMMETGWLSEIRGVRLDTGTSISDVKVSRADYQDGALSEAVNVKARNDTAVKGYLALAEGRQALVFCVDVAHTQDMTRAFQTEGIAAGYVVGSSSSDERHHVIETYRRRDLQVLCNCMVLTEGFDAPETDCIIMARPTKSSLLYTQMLGRGTRLAEGKKDLVVLDLVDIAGAGVNTVNTLFGLPPKLDLSSVGVLGAGDELSRVLEQVSLEQLAEATTIEDVLRLAREFNPLLAAQLPDYLSTTMAWVKVGSGYALSLSKGSIGVVVNQLGGATVKHHLPGERVRILGQLPGEQQALTWAEEMVSKDFPADLSLVNRNAAWRRRKDPPTEKQLLWCRKMKVNVPDGATKADVQIILSRAFNS
ncbi:MAG: DEAD/DEAH box helicase [Chloroflexi bacterium]|nr:DEAD/DEAH box helicase [Chloroflexota bacterium]